MYAPAADKPAPTCEASNSSCVKPKFVVKVETSLMRVAVSDEIAFPFASIPAVKMSSALSYAATISANEFNAVSSVLFKMLLICVCKPVSANL